MVVARKPLYVEKHGLCVIYHVLSLSSVKKKDSKTPSPSLLLCIYNAQILGAVYPICISQGLFHSLYLKATSLLNPQIFVQYCGTFVGAGTL